MIAEYASYHMLDAIFNEIHLTFVFTYITRKGWETAYV